jgi:hypothetical protein
MVFGAFLLIWGLLSYSEDGLFTILVGVIFLTIGVIGAVNGRRLPKLR